ncbi:MAG: single-stranded DNA-binding protein [Flavobacteriales bacterium]|nr:single-stranded DNA-binding protein [Flavobacteriales bacterium]
MNALKNRVLLIGNLGKDPEFLSFDKGTKKAQFPLATTEIYKNAEGEKVEDTHWHNIVTWGKTAELAKNYLKKGSQVAVEGRLTHRQYEDGEGKKRYVTEIVVSDLLMLNKKD